MSEDEEIMVQRILGLLGYTDEKTTGLYLEETLKLAYEKVRLLKDQAAVGRNFLIAVDSVQTYREWHG